MFGNSSWVGSKIHRNTELWTQSKENQWNSSGIFSQDSLHCSSSTKSKSSWAKCAIQNNSKDESPSCRCSMTSYGDLKTMKRNVLVIPHLCLCSQKDFQQDVGHSLDLGRKMGSSRWTDDDQIRRKRTPSFPSKESVLSRHAQKQRRWKIIFSLLCRWRK